MKLTRIPWLIVAALAVALALAGPAPAQSWSAPVTAINAVATTTTSSAIDTSSATSACVQFTSASTSTATGEVLISANGTSYDSAISTSDPTSGGAVLCGPTGRKLEAKVTRSAGTLSAHVIYRSFPGDPFAVGGWRRISVGANSFGALAVTSLTNSGLTSGRVPYSSTGGLQVDSSAFTFSAGTLSATTFAGAFNGSTVTSSTLTTGRVPFNSTAGLLIDEAALAYDTSTNTLSADILKGGAQSTTTAKATDGAIASAPGTIVITKTSALGSSTLATPTTTTHDGYLLRIVSTTAYAHAISVASGKVNGGSNTTITFTSAAIGDGVTLLAYQGVWYVVASRGTITLS